MLHWKAIGRFINMIAAVAAVTFLAMVAAPANAQSNCCAVHGLSGCDEAHCEALICSEDPFCCQTQWDGICAGAALEQCEVCGHTNCCSAKASPGCDNADCEALTCARDPYCCEVVWDACCANLAVEHCSNLPGCRPTLPPDPPQFQPLGPPPIACGLPNAGDCFDPDGNGSPGCDDLNCCVSVCQCDPFCCEVQWDWFCYDPMFWVDCFCGPGQCGSVQHCSPGPPPAFSCQGNCGGAVAGGCWCDESCCHFGDCCKDKAYQCLGCTPDQPGAIPISQYSTCQGACSDLPGTGGGGCSCDEGCCERGDCCPDKQEHCGGCQPPPRNPADLTGNNMVGVVDLLRLLDRWGACEFERCFVLEPCKGDFNHDHEVNVFDLIFLLENWG